MKRSHTRRKKEKMDNSVLWILAGLFLFFIYPSQTADAPSSTNSYLTDADRVKMKNILDVGYKFNDLSTAHYLVVGYKSMGERIKREAEICGFLISSAKEPSLSAESIYYIASTWKALGVCQPKSLNLNTLTKALNSYLDKESSNFQTLYYTIHSLVSFGEKIPEATVTKVVNTLQNALKKDYTISNAGYAFHIAADLGAAASFAFNHVEDAIAEADEIDSKFLQYEGGLSVTSLIVNGVYKLSASLKKKPPINLLQTVKFANYFLSRRSVQTSKGAANLLSSVSMLATSEYEKPICISLTDDGVIISNKQPHIKVKICDILGKPITSISNVVANTATKVGDDVVVISKKNFQSTPNDKSVFTLNFLAANPDPGFYKIAVSAGSIQNTLTVKVLTEIVVDSFEIGAADADQITQPKLTKLEYPKKLSKTVEADFQQKIILKFSLKETNKNKPMRVHQAFVRLTPASSKDKQELIFTAEADSSNVYKFEMPVSNSAKMFNYQNGDYNIELIIGDAVLSNSFQWVLGTVSLKFPEGAVSDDVKKPPYKQPNVYTLQTEIKHMFREPEKRPPVFVSNLFTGLCLAPLLLLLILWIKLDINISNFPLSLSAIIFHLGLGCIFVLFGIFWLQLNMFTTLRYLTVLGIITFLSGHKLLSQIAKNRKLHS